MIVSNPLIIDQFKTKNMSYYINNVSNQIFKENINDKEGINQVREELLEVKKMFYEQIKDISRLDVKYNEYNNFFMWKINNENISARKLERFLNIKWIMIKLCEWIPWERIRISLNSIKNNKVLISAFKGINLIDYC